MAQAQEIGLRAAQIKAIKPAGYYRQQPTWVSGKKEIKGNRDQIPPATRFVAWLSQKGRERQFAKAGSRLSRG